MRPPRSGQHDGVSAHLNLDGGDLALYELSVRDGGRLRSAVRWVLFVFPAVRDVLVGRDPDRVLVVHRGPPQRTAWIEALRNAGFDTQPTAEERRSQILPRRSTRKTGDRPTED